MADRDTAQHYLGRNRPPRVQITYDVEIGNAFEKKELPLVVGILADLSGTDSKVVPLKLGDRPFVNIDTDNFNAIMTTIEPRVTFNVKSLLGDPNAEGQNDAVIPVDLTFKTFEDFSPEKIVDQVTELKALFDKRKRLQDLLIKLDGDAELDKELIKSLASEDAIKEFKALLDAPVAPVVEEPKPKE